MCVKEIEKQDFQFFALSCSLFIELDLRISVYLFLKVVEQIMTEDFSIGVLATAKAN